jgi:hypothetical protein
METKSQFTRISKKGNHLNLTTVQRVGFTWFSCILMLTRQLTLMLTRQLTLMRLVGIFGGNLIGVRSTAGLSFYDWENTELIRRIEIQPKSVREMTV